MRQFVLHATALALAFAQDEGDCRRCVADDHSYARFRQTLTVDGLLNECWNGDNAVKDAVLCDRGNSTGMITMCYNHCTVGDSAHQVYNPGLDTPHDLLMAGMHQWGTKACMPITDCSDCIKNTGCSWVEDAAGHMGCVPKRFVTENAKTVVPPNKLKPAKFQEITTCPDDCTKCTAAGINGVFQLHVGPKPYGQCNGAANCTADSFEHAQDIKLCYKACNAIQDIQVKANDKVGPLELKAGACEAITDCEKCLAAPDGACKWVADANTVTACVPKDLAKAPLTDITDCSFTPTSKPGAAGSISIVTAIVLAAFSWLI